MAPSFSFLSTDNLRSGFLFSGKGKTKVSQTKSELRTAWSSITQRTNVPHKLSAEIFTSTSTASRDFGTNLTPGRAKNTLINCMWYRSRFEQSWFSSHLSSLPRPPPPRGVLLGILGGDVPPGSKSRPYFRPKRYLHNTLVTWAWDACDQTSDLDYSDSVWATPKK